MKKTLGLLGLVAVASVGCGGPTATTATSTTTVVSTVTAQAPASTVTVTYTPPPPPGPAVRLDGGEGIFVVGTDIRPGRWRTDGGGSSCYWARLGDLTGDDILDNSNTTGPTTIDILPSDVGFELRHCQPWYLVG